MQVLASWGRSRGPDFGKSRMAMGKSRREDFGRSRIAGLGKSHKADLELSRAEAVM
jgi:hypothetical protein